MEQFETLLKESPVGACLIDSGFRLAGVNPAALPVLANSPDLVGRDFDEAAHILWASPSADEIVSEFRRTLTTGQPSVTRVKELEWRSARIPWSEGQFGLVCYVRDLSGTTRPAEAVARLTKEAEFQQRFYETILATTPDLVYVFGRDHRFTYANPALLTMWGMTAEEAIGKNCLELGYEPWHAAMHDREIEQVIATKQPIRGDVPFSGTNGRRMYDYIFVPVLGTTGEVEAVAGTTRDVTERHSAEQELRRANEDLQQFAYAATHDLQEPLRTMKVYSEVLRQRYAPRLDGEALECLRFVASGAVRMEHLIRDLLSYTKAGSEQLPVELADANTCVETALANLAASIAESGAEFILQPLPTVRIHDTQLQQIFQNLAGNAIKYRRPDLTPVINISAKLEDADWQFTVADNGIGIEERHRKHVFGLFKRLHSNDKYSGTGIGLALCQRIVERNNGRIWVESELGQGSQFHFTLPA